MKQAQDWLVDPEALVGSAGQLTLSIDHCSSCYRMLAFVCKCSFTLGLVQHSVVQRYNARFGVKEVFATLWFQK